MHQTARKWAKKSIRARYLRGWRALRGKQSGSASGNHTTDGAVGAERAEFGRRVCALTNVRARTSSIIWAPNSNLAHRLARGRIFVPIYLISSCFLAAELIET